jgi:hypothetical protein
MNKHPIHEELMALLRLANTPRKKKEATKRFFALMQGTKVQTILQGWSHGFDCNGCMNAGINLTPDPAMRGNPGLAKCQRFGCLWAHEPTKEELAAQEERNLKNQSRRSWDD